MEATELLGDAFGLEFVPDVSIQTGESGEAIRELTTGCSSPFRKLAESLDADTLAEFRAAWIAYYGATARRRDPRAQRLHVDPGNAKGA